MSKYSQYKNDTYLANLNYANAQKERRNKEEMKEIEQERIAMETEIRIATLTQRTRLLVPISEYFHWMIACADIVRYVVSNESCEVSDTPSMDFIIVSLSAVVMCVPL